MKHTFRILRQMRNNLIIRDIENFEPVLELWHKFENFEIWKWDLWDINNLRILRKTFEKSDIEQHLYQTNINEKCELWIIHSDYWHNIFFLKYLILYETLMRILSQCENHDTHLRILRLESETYEILITWEFWGKRLENQI